MFSVGRGFTGYTLRRFGFCYVLLATLVDGSLNGREPDSEHQARTFGDASTLKN